jgi:3-oxoacyl-[acyl-carrier protein] reductase
MSRLSEKVAIVTGASKGIGAGIATALGAAGACVAVNYSSDREGAGRVARAITDNGGKAIAVGADVSKAADVARLFKEVDSAFGRLDVLVNNAGVFRFAPRLACFHAAQANRDVWFTVASKTLRSCLNGSCTH